jgi:streptogramin lyase
MRRIFHWAPIALVALMLLPGSAVAAPALDGTFDVSGLPERLTLGSDGNVWFTLSGSPALKEFGRIKPDGTVDEYDTPGDVSVIGITSGPGGHLWMTASNAIVEVDPANPTAGVAHGPIDITQPETIVVGPDGNLWTAGADKIFKIGTNGNEITHYTVSGLLARGIASAGGFLWVADHNGRIIKTPTDTAPTDAMKFDVGGGPQEVGAGPAGQLGFSNPEATPQFFGRMDYNGAFQPTNFPPATDPAGIVFGNDGAYWFGEFAAQALGRITPDGQYTQLPLGAGTGPRHLTKGLGDTLWVGLQGNNKIARITGVSAPPAPPQPPIPTPDTVPPVVSGYGFASKVIRALTSGGSIARVTRGTKVSYTLSEAATATFTVQRVAAGRKVKVKKKTRCVRQTRTNRRKRKCTRFVTVGSFSRLSTLGQNSFKFTGRIKNRALKPGRYRMLLVARDAAGNASKAKAVRFRVVK